MIPIHGVWYLLLLHHSQTSVSGVRSRSSVWYLLLLHHSQTTDSIIVQHIQVCTFCFYIILKPDRLTCCTPAGLVSSAFTSFSNSAASSFLNNFVWYLLLLHHSQTSCLLICLQPQFGTFCFYIILKPLFVFKKSLFGTFCFYIILKLVAAMIANIAGFGTFCFYIILKLPAISFLFPNSFGTFCFYIILKLQIVMRRLMSGLVPSAFTSFSNPPVCLPGPHSVWYLLLLHHSQTRAKLFGKISPFGTFCFYIILKQSTKPPIVKNGFGTFCFYIILKPGRAYRNRGSRFGTFCFYIILKPMRRHKQSLL